MSESELHRKVLEVLGFEVIRQGYHDYDQQYINGYLLTKHGKMIRFSPCYADSQAWAQAPTLDALMIPLLKTLFTQENKYGVLLDGGLFSGVMMYTATWQDGSMEQRATTITEAIAALFLAACEAGLIDPKDVVI